jgi:head-tail adaptor
MALIDANDLAMIRATQVDSLHDTCVLMPRVTDTATDGQVTETWVSGATVACGFEPTGGNEQRRADMTVLAYDAKLRLALGAAITYLDKVRIIKRYGSALTTPLTFQVEGDPQQGASGLVLLLKRVTT